MHLNKFQKTYFAKTKFNKFLNLLRVFDILSIIFFKKTTPNLGVKKETYSLNLLIAVFAKKYLKGTSKDLILKKLKNADLRKNFFNQS